MKNLVNLKYLDCSHNFLTSLEGIENLTNLEQLNCGYNQLISLKGIEKLNNLWFLNCDDNLLRSLEGIENLQYLKFLYCHNNFLTLSKEIENLTKLIKNHKLKWIYYNFMDSDDSEYNIKLKNLFDTLLKYKNMNVFNEINKINEYIVKIEQMIDTSNVSQKYVLK
jgi:Leucine-rich repeat (LRR) protein